MIEHLPILYVEDSGQDAELFSRALFQMSPNLRLFHFRDGQSAQEFSLSIIGKQSLQMIVVDLHLPGMSGMELIQWFQTQEHLRSVPVIIVSGEFSFEDEAHAKQMGVNLCLRKPRDYDGWIDLVYQVENCYSVE